MNNDDDNKIYLLGNCYENTIDKVLANQFGKSQLITHVRNDPIYKYSTGQPD